MFSIRRAGPADAAPLAELAARTFAEAFAAGNTAEDLAAFLAATYGEAQQRREILDQDVITLLVEEGGTLIAFAQLRRGEAPQCVEGPDPVELARFYVDRPWHGRGVAQQLMEAARAAAQNLGARTFWLGVWERNPRAIAFYEKCGFRDVGSHLFLVGSDLQTDRVMVHAGA
ncbi:MAG TPA: GNAT family N-acetyltransferase [Thermoanaerobaculia bacterium]|jgi:GNAT superfamily N-acetyltransferase|nr:GNAT family N-acetyltransferase [Thermoanaerobaculia bacterium]